MQPLNNGSVPPKSWFSRSTTDNVLNALPGKTPEQQTKLVRGLLQHLIDNPKSDTLARLKQVADICPEILKSELRYRVSHAPQQNSPVVATFRAFLNEPSSMVAANPATTAVSAAIVHRGGHNNHSQEAKSDVQPTGVSKTPNSGSTYDRSSFYVGTVGTALGLGKFETDGDIRNPNLDDDDDDDDDDDLYQSGLNPATTAVALLTHDDYYDTDAAVSPVLNFNYVLNPNNIDGPSDVLHAFNEQLTAEVEYLSQSGNVTMASLIELNDRVMSTVHDQCAEFASEVQVGVLSAIAESLGVDIGIPLAGAMYSVRDVFQQIVDAAGN